MMDSLPPIADREYEHLLPVGDIGMRQLRDMYLKAVETVKAGGDPKGTVRDKRKNQLIVITAYERLISVEEYRQMQGAAA